MERRQNRWVKKYHFVGDWQGKNIKNLLLLLLFVLCQFITFFILFFNASIHLTSVHHAFIHQLSISLIFHLKSITLTIVIISSHHCLSTMIHYGLIAKFCYFQFIIMCYYQSGVSYFVNGASCLGASFMWGELS